MDELHSCSGTLTAQRIIYAQPLPAHARTVLVRLRFESLRRAPSHGAFLLARGYVADHGRVLAGVAGEIAEERAAELRGARREAATYPARSSAQQMPGDQPRRSGRDVRAIKASKAATEPDLSDAGELRRAIERRSGVRRETAVEFSMHRALQPVVLRRVAFVAFYGAIRESCAAASASALGGSGASARGWSSTR